MKPTILWLALASGLVLSGLARAASSNAPAAVDTQLGPEFQQAVRLLEAGRDREAEPILRQILKSHPNHPTVRYLLQQIEERRARDSAGAYRETLAKLIVPEVNVRDANPADVVDYLRAESAKLTADKEPVNIVLLGSPATQGRRVTLTLRKIPLLDALGFAAKAAGLAMRVEAHAVVLEPPAPAPGGPTESAAHAEP